LNMEEAAHVYYKSRPDAYDMRSPYYRWERSWTPEELKNNLQMTLVAQSATGFIKPAFTKYDSLGDITELKVLKRGESGKIIEMEIVTSDRIYKVQKELVIRRLLTKDGKALPSANVVFDNIKDEDGNLIEIKAFGGGYGHGVGMSQFGAGFMGSELHRPYYKILQHYYTGITLGTKPEIVSAEPSKLSAEQNFYTSEKYAKIFIDNKFGVNNLKIDINGHEKIYELPKELFGHKRYTEIDISQFIQKGRNTVVVSAPELQESSVNKGLRFYIEIKEKDDSDW